MGTKGRLSCPLNSQTNVLEWVQYPEDTADTRTEYTYDTMYRLAAAACETDTGSSLSAAYTYTDDLLTKIQTGSTAYHFTYGSFGLRTAVKVGTRNLAQYSYTDDGNNFLERLDYGNQDSVNYTYDKKGRLLTQTYEDGDTVTYTYDNDGALAEVYDSATGITTRYYYDLTGRQMKYSENGTGYSHSVGYEYDTLNNLSGLVEYINGTERTTTYTYDDDNRIKTSATGNITVAYDYDSFGRVSTQTTKNGDTVILTESYTYKASASTTTSAQIATYTTAVPNGYTVTYSYTYDDNGNITGVSDGTNTTTYVYDSANQLIRENNQAGGYTHVWTYDNAGNILTRKEYAYTTGSLESQTPTDTAAYTYGNGDWGDLLTAYDGSSITYDGIGNTLNDGEWTYTWEHGRELAGMSKAGTTWTYTYNADGLRTKRTNGTDTYTYVYNGSQLTQMTKGTDTLNFAYDASGVPLTVTWNGNAYYYVTNLQGDVVAILDSTGTAVVSYTYDAWGNILSTTGSMASTLGTLNPLRYRGYIYDTETGLYYVSSRYYDPEIGRFINADDIDLLGANGDFTSLNLFVYCGNNPVIRRDITGYAWETVFDIVSLATSVAEVIANPMDPWAWAGLVGDVIDVAVPFVAGVGEATRAVKTTVRVINATDDVVDTAKALRHAADAASDVKKATGTYVALYKSGKTYVGKGGLSRAITSAAEHMSRYGDEVSALIWAPTTSQRSAFLAEYFLQSLRGVGRNLDDTYNIIWSPGRNLLK